MFCPKCGQQQLSDEVRFCSRCGVNLGMVTSWLADDNEVSMTGSTVDAPKHRNINAGVTLMFSGTLLTGILIMSSSGALGPVGALLLLTFILALLRLFARPLIQAIHRLFSWQESSHASSSSQKEFRFGAAMMFISSMLAAYISSIAPGPSEELAFFLALLILFLLTLLSSKFLMRAIQRLTDDEKPANKSVLTGPDPVNQFGTTLNTQALPPQQSVPVSLFDSQRTDTKEIVEPPSITEHTTSLLNEKLKEG